MSSSSLTKHTMFKPIPIALLLAITSVAPSWAARKWGDATGKYTVEGDLVGATDTMVVIQKTDKKKNLVALRISQLSQSDQDFVQSREAADAAQKAGGEQTWTMQ